VCVWGGALESHYVAQVGLQLVILNYSLCTTFVWQEFSFKLNIQREAIAETGLVRLKQQN
jgi:hypothetical protein